jgi:hypothetical protein
LIVHVHRQILINMACFKKAVKITALGRDKPKYREIDAKTGRGSYRIIYQEVGSLPRRRGEIGAQKYRDAVAGGAAPHTLAALAKDVQAYVLAGAFEVPGGLAGLTAEMLMAVGNRVPDF